MLAATLPLWSRLDRARRMAVFLAGGQSRSGRVSSILRIWREMCLDTRGGRVLALRAGLNGLVLLLRSPLVGQGGEEG